MGDCCVRMHALIMGFRDADLAHVISNAFLYQVAKFAEGQHSSGDIF